MTLIKDLIEIPDRVDKGDFVLKLAEGVESPRSDAARLRRHARAGKHASTPPCRSSAAPSRATTSKATYLHGSFGSGKSHFMAVLHLILQGNPAARGDPRAGPGHQEAQRLARRQEVPARALSHDRRPRHGVGHPGRLRGRSSAARIPTRRSRRSTCRRRSSRQAESRASQLRRRAVLQAARTTEQRRPTASWGDARAGLGRRRRSRRPRRRRPDSEPHLQLVSTLI